jgi:predicted metal-dependent hydrolase
VDERDQPDLPKEDLAAFERGLRLFDAGAYFECHDVWEEVWQGLRTPSRDFLQGLIQAAVAFHHLGNGNLAGAGSVLGRSLSRLSRYGERHWGLDLGQLRAELRGWLERVSRAEQLETPRPRLKDMA